MHRCVICHEAEPSCRCVAGDEAFDESYPGGALYTRNPPSPRTFRVPVLPVDELLPVGHERHGSAVLNHGLVEELTTRLLARPDLLKVVDPFLLLKDEQVRKLNPTMFQALLALEQAKKRHQWRMTA